MDPWNEEGLQQRKTRHRRPARQQDEEPAPVIEGSSQGPDEAVEQKTPAGKKEEVAAKKAKEKNAPQRRPRKLLGVHLVAAILGVVILVAVILIVVRHINPLLLGYRYVEACWGRCFSRRVSPDPCRLRSPDTGAPEAIDIPTQPPCFIDKLDAVVDRFLPDEVRAVSFSSCWCPCF